MSQYTSFAAALAACLLLASCAHSAPTSDAPEASSTTAAPATTSAATSASSAPTTTPQAQESSSTASMAVSSAQDHAAAAHVPNTTFTCYNRKIGYYADMEAHCNVYHFCMLGDYNGQEVYQRISYLCLNSTSFDQQALDCVEPAKMRAPCSESEKFYEESNAILRSALVGKSMVQDEKTPETPEKPAAAATEESAAASTTAAPAPASTEAPAAST